MIYFFEKYGEKISLVTSKRQKIDENGNILEDDLSTKLPNIKLTNDGYSLLDGIETGDLMMTSLTNFIGEPTTVMFPKKLIENTKPNIFSMHDKEVFGNGDMTIWFNLLVQGKAIYIYETLSSFRIHSTQSQQSTIVKYLCTKHWYQLLYDLPKVGFLKSKKDYLISSSGILGVFNFLLNELELTNKQQESFIDIIKDLEKIVIEFERKCLYCSVCGNYIDEFLPLSSYYSENNKKYGHLMEVDDYETINDKNYTCPNCYSSDRDRLYALYLHKIIQKNSSKLRIIEFAPSYCLTRYIKLTNKFEHRSADLYMKNVDDNIDITDLNIYKDNLFDCFICSHVLEHVLDDTKALSELYRVLKPDGWGIIMAPVNIKIEKTYEDETIVTSEERWKHFGQDDHVRVYSKSDFKKRITDAGFELQECDKSFFEIDDFEKYGITNKSVLYIAHKKIDFDIIIEKANNNFSNGNYVEAESLYKNLKNYFPENYIYHFNLGISQLKQEKYDESLDTFSEYLDYFDANKEILLNISLCLEKIGDLDTSKEYYQKSFELDI